MGVWNTTKKLAIISLIFFSSCYSPKRINEGDDRLASRKESTAFSIGYFDEIFHLIFSLR